LDLAGAEVNTLPDSARQAALWLEHSAVGVWTRESPSIWAYPTVLTLHTMGLGVLVGANAVIDFTLLGFAPRLPLPSLSPLYRFMWAGFAVNLATGVMLFAADATTKGKQPVFYLKLALIAVALMITAVLRKRVERGRAPGDVESGAGAGRRLAALSLVLWAGAITAGRLMAYL
jgi:hypothetical protein